MRYPARCNLRICQARRNLRKPLDQYVRQPRCHIAGCEGVMYVDWCRFRKAEGRPVCYEDCYHFPHSVASPKCRKRTDYMIDQSLRSPKHRPHDGGEF